VLTFIKPIVDLFFPKTNSTPKKEDSNFSQKMAEQD